MSISFAGRKNSVVVASWPVHNERAVKFEKNAEKGCYSLINKKDATICGLTGTVGYGLDHSVVSEAASSALMQPSNSYERRSNSYSINWVPTSADIVHATAEPILHYHADGAKHSENPATLT